MTLVVGIDLGTTYSAIASVNDRGEPVVLPNAVGTETTPSNIFFESAGRVLVGQAAKEAAVTAAESTIGMIKRQMGNEYPLNFFGVEHSPESLSALILRSLVADALKVTGQSGPVRAVITVPAYFGVREREATHQAAVLAGIDVLELLSEPVAATVAYGMHASGDSAVAVYDLGGGTFDTTVLVIDSHGIAVVATDGDATLGGADWDERVFGHLLEAFCAVSTDSGDAASGDEGFLAELLLVAERVKRDLTARTSRRVVVRRGQETVTVDLTRTAFEAMTRDLLDRTFTIVARNLASAEARGMASIDAAILVGGSSRMPIVAAGLTERFGWRTRSVEPDFAVAKGAAIRAHQLAGGSHLARLAHPGGTTSAVARLTMRSVVPRSFGLLVHDSHDPAGERCFIDHVVHRNDPLPVSGATARFATITDNQQAVRIEIMEQAGEVESADPVHNRRVLDGELTGLPDLPAGSPIDVAFELGLDGRLSVSVTEPGSGVALHLVGYIDGVLDTPAHKKLAERLSVITVRA
jgi:molecular chaperone DnaK